MPTQTANWVGQVLSGGRYQVTARLGEGGMAFVFRAADRNLGCDVVIKVPRPALLQEPEFAGRFAREVRSLVQLQHPHIVKLSDVGTHEGIPFAVMQYLPGGSLRDRLQPGPDGIGRPRPPAELRGWLAEVAAALDFMHREGYLHRDVKPDNILFDQHGNVFLSDFGIAKALADAEVNRAQKTVLTNAGMVLGTAPYMAPEVLLGQAYDGRVDQYALAVTVYQLLSGVVPFEGATPAAIVLQQAANGAPPLHERLPSLPRALAAVVHKGMHRDPRQRFPTCRAFAEAALAAALGQALPVQPLAPPQSVATAMAAAVVSCPRCQKRFRLPAVVEGKRLRCPACQAVYMTPDARPDSKPDLQQTQADTAASGRSPTPPLAQAAEAGNRQDPRGQRGRGRGTAVLWLSSIIMLAATAFCGWQFYKQRRGPAVEVQPPPLVVETNKPPEKVPEKEQAPPPSKWYRGKTLAQWATALRSSDGALRQEAAAALVEARTAAVPILSAALQDDNPTVRAAALSSLRQLGRDAAPALPQLLGCLRDPDAQFRETSVVALGEICGQAGAWDGAVVAALCKALQKSDEEPRVRCAAAAVLGSVERPPATVAATMAHVLKEDGNVIVRQHVARALGRMSDRPITLLRQALKDDDILVRLEAVRSVSRFSVEAATDAVPELRRCAWEKDRELRAEARAALTRLGVKSFAPPLTKTPFSREKAKELQATWAGYLGREVVETLDLGDGVKMAFVLIPPGTYTMGSPTDEPGRHAKSEAPHEVTIAQPFYLGRYEVTRKQFRQFVRARAYVTEAEKDGVGGWGYDEAAKSFKGPVFDLKTGFYKEGNKTAYTWKDPGFAQTDDHPVVNACWNDAEAFCRWLADRSNRTIRLPTETQWEYACRAGTQTAYYFGNDPEGLARHGNVADGTAKKKFPGWTAIQAEDHYVFTAPVGSFPANAFGLYDMHGNVTEWCQDGFRVDGGSIVNAVYRGGSWTGVPIQCRAAERLMYPPKTRRYDLGYRVCIILN